MQIPVVDLEHFQNETHRAEFVSTLGKSLEELGFVAVINHGVSDELLAKTYSCAEAMFALPAEVKKGCEVATEGRQRGYTSFGVEHAKDQMTPDLKEFWQIGRNLGEGHPLHISGEVPANHFPGQLPESQVIFSSLFEAMESFANTLLDAVGIYLDKPEGFFRDMVHQSNSVLRAIHYPDLGVVPKGAVRAAQHEDINLLTVLPASTRPGLEILTHEGEWLPVQTPPKVMICDTGDMMAHITGGRLRSTTHRVVNPDAQDGGRYSMPFFLHPRPDFMLTPPEGSKEMPVLAKTFLRRRLEEIGLV